MLSRLRDEILVVCDYEGLVHAFTIVDAIENYRRSRGDTCLVDRDELVRTLFRMVEMEYLLEPWVTLKRNPKTAIRVGDLKGEDPIGRDPMRLYYRLTPRGRKMQREIISDLVHRKTEGWR